MRLARDIDVRSAASRGAARSRGRVSMIERAASTASVSETGFELTFQIDSSECESASRALLSITLSGAESVSAGSTSAQVGHVSRTCSEYFRPVLEVRSQSVAQGVTSLP